LSDIDLQVEEGKTHAIIGPNGAGKSTLLNVIIGRWRRPAAPSCSTAGPDRQEALPDQPARRRPGVPDAGNLPRSLGAAPFDKERKRTYETATKLLLAPGISQIYYGDETGRKLIVAGAEGDANLRSNMNWEDIKNNPETQKLLEHWQKLGQFRRNHPAVGAGFHKMISNSPYWFSRTHKTVKTKFSKEALAQKVTDINGKTISISKILEKIKAKFW
jgi:energy-coupling factor transporter ATP-binding protein EcfA2